MGQRHGFPKVSGFPQKNFRFGEIQVAPSVFQVFIRPCKQTQRCESFVASGGICVHGLGRVFKPQGFIKLGKEWV